MLVLATIALIVYMLFSSLSLVKTSNRTSTSYSLPKELREMIKKETKGLSVNGMVDYSLRLTGELLSFSEKNDLLNGIANCVGYALVCSSICNYGLEANGLEGRCRPVAGYVKCCGLNLCNILRWIAPKKYKDFVKDHDFVEYKLRTTTLLFDPSLYDCFRKKALTIIDNE